MPESYQTIHDEDLLLKYQVMFKYQMMSKCSTFKYRLKCSMVSDCSMLNGWHCETDKATQTFVWTVVEFRARVSSHQKLFLIHISWHTVKQWDTITNLENTDAFWIYTHNGFAKSTWAGASRAKLTYHYEWMTFIHIEFSKIISRLHKANTWEDANLQKIKY